MYAYNVFYYIISTGTADMVTVAAPSAELAKKCFLDTAQRSGAGDDYEVTKVQKVAKEYQRLAKIHATLKYDRYGRYGK